MATTAPSNSTITSDSVSSSSADATSSLASAISSSIASEVSSSIVSQQDSTTTVEPSTTNVITSTVSASSAAPSTNIITSVVTQSATSNGVTDTNPVTVVVTSVNNPTTTNVQTVPASSPTSAASTTSSQPAAISNGSGSGGGSGGGSSGLSTAGKTAIAVVIPVAFVALLVGLGIWFWRKRKQRKDDREQRRKEIDEYGYNPNNDPTLPAVGSDAGGPQMAEDSNAGYRGWGAAAGSNRKASTTLSGGHTQGQLSESGNSYGHSPGSPGGTGAYSDGHSGDPLVNQRDTMGSDELGALGAAPLAGNKQGIRRGPSNASSAYSAGGRSEASDEPAVPPLPNNQYDLNPTNSYGYSQHGPYGDGSYGGGVDNAGMPVVRDVSARRNTRIQQAGSYQQGNSGIAQNF